MKKLLLFLLAFLFTFSVTACEGGKQGNSTPSDLNSENSTDESIVTIEKQISNDELYDKILGSWVGQAAGVVWGAPTEFVYGGRIIPENEVPSSDNLDMNGMFTQDDLYVEIPFIQAMLENGVDCDIKYLADAFKETTFPLWHANLASRDNLKAGIEAPLSGNPLYNDHSDDIDWQIEADFVGHMYPGLINEAAQKAFEIGHIMNYGDGVYGGVFVTAMHAAAFFAEDIDEIIDAGINSIPEGTTFRQIMDDVMKCYDEGKTWEECWQVIETKWGKTDTCINLASSDLNIDAKMNSAYILIGLLYGEGDFEESIKISMRCGQDSDCNPSSVGAILGNFYGYKALDSKWKNIDMEDGKFQYTEYTLDNCVQGNITLLNQVLSAKGFTESNGMWTININTVIKPVEFEQRNDTPAIDIIADNQNGAVVLSVKIIATGEIKSFEWNMGDETIYTTEDVFHVYKAVGEYKITCKVTDADDNVVIAEKTINVDKIISDYDKTDAGTVRNIASISIPLCNVKDPKGVGAKNLSVLSDGIKTGGSAVQYDTFDYATKPYEQYFAYLFPVEFKVSSVIFTEGMHFNNGGWFQNGDIRLETLVDGEWIEIQGTSSPDYPNGDTTGIFGSAFESYTFDIDDYVCSGIRIIGIGGGSASFISAAEIEVFATEVE
ncbi:MAG: hypothetical protein A2Y17_10715 [Clostridiales bacterium GWF2_38_85]|nr:MAG: hypothetical protein A2Y17_10715 [Clostridiales bacterium GWF2_38_85]HBL83501.1 hypothetical protein [Clostridiales bacterium]